MKLFAIFACVAFLYGVSSETPDLDDRVTIGDGLEEPATAIESNDFGNDDDDSLAANTAVDEWDEEAAMDLAEGQGDEEWDEAHISDWMSDAEQAQVSYALDSGISALTKPRLGCTDCSRTRGDCRCCFVLKILFNSYDACLVAYFKDGYVGVKATVDSKIVVSGVARMNRKRVVACRDFLRKRLCVILRYIRVRGHQFSARGTFRVSGLITKRTGRFTVAF